MKDLRCSYSECSSRAGDDIPMFRVRVTVGPTREMAERLEDLEPAYFECVHCGFAAEEDEGDDT